LKYKELIYTESRIIFIILIVLMLFPSVGYSQKSETFVQDSLFSIELQRKGVASGRLGDFDEAMSYFNQLYRLREKMYGQDSYRLASTLINIGIQYKSLGNLEKAIEYYKKAELLYLKEFGNDYSGLGIIYTNIGNIYGLTGDYNKALEYHRNAYRVLQNAITRFNDNFQDSKFNIAEAQFKLGNNKEAIRFAEFFRELLGIPKPEG